MSWSSSRPSQLIQLLDDAITSGDDDLAEIIRSDLYREFGIERADGGRVGMNTGGSTGGLPTVASVLGLQSLSAQQNPTSTPDLDAMGLQSLLSPRPDLAAMTQQAGNPMNVSNPYNYGYGPSADFGRRNVDALTYTGDTTFPTLQQIFGQDTGTLTQEQLDARLAEQQGNLSSTYQSQIDAKAEAMKQAQAQHAAALAEQQASAASASSQAQSQEAALQAQLAELQAQLEAAQNVQPQIQYVPQYIQRPPGGGGSCFVAGTLVTMEDGTLKKIEEVEIGDKVKGEESVNMVTDYDHPLLGDRKLYSINNGGAFVTSEHPFKTLEGWKSIDPEDTAKETDLDVKKLDVGDIIITGKDDVKVDSIEEHDGNAEDTVYNFILNGDRTYYADGYLVHNKGGGPGGGGGCFVEGTPIDMADGTTKEITGVRVGEETKGGRVIAKLEFEPTKIYNYQGVYVSGTHLVLEGNEMIEVQNSKHGILTDRIEPVYCFETTNNRIWVQGIEFGDYLTGSQKDWEPYIEMMRKKVNAEIQDRHQEV